MLRRNSIDGSYGVIPTLGRMARRPMLALVIAGGLGNGSRVLAQAELQGRVIADSTRRPVMNAEIAIPRLSLKTLSDSLGRYRLREIPRGEYLVITRAVGFRPDSSRTTFDGDEALLVDIQLRPPVAALQAVRVRGAAVSFERGKMSGYEERKATGIGRFVDHDVVAKYEDRRTSELLSMVPGIDIRPGSGAKAYAVSGRTRLSGRCALCRTIKDDNQQQSNIGQPTGGPCYMDVYLDGVAVFYTQGAAGGLFDLNTLNLKTVEAVEVYAGGAQVPAEFNRTSGGCGVIVIWTKVPR
jgi:hypothetical protein